MKKQNIFLISANPLGWRKTPYYGGGELITKSIIENIPLINYMVVSTKNNCINIYKNIKVYQTITLNLFNSGILDPINFILFTLQTIFYGYILRKKINIVYASTTNISDLLPAVITGKILNKPIITKLHISIYNGNKNNLKNIYKNLKQENHKLFLIIFKLLSISLSLKLLNYCNIVLCTNENLKNNIENKINRNINVLVVPNGIDIKKIKNLIKNINKKIYDLCFIARLEKYKGIYSFIDIVKTLKITFPNIKVIIIGVGPEYTNAISKVNSLKLHNNIKFTGFLNDARYKYLAQSKFLLSLSTSNEGWGLTIAESLACNTHVICLSNTTLQNVYKNINRVEFFKNKEEIIEKLKEILNSKQNPNINIENKFNIEKIAMIEEEILNVILTN